LQPKHRAALSVEEAIETRRSIRAFQPDPIDRADLEEIIRLTTLAPSARNLQPWRFHVVTDPTLKQQLQEAAFGQPWVGSAPAVILITIDMEDTLARLDELVHPSLPPAEREKRIRSIRADLERRTPEERIQWGMIDASIALGFLLLAARAMGYGTVPMLGFDHVKARQILNLPEHVRVAFMVPIGRPAEEGRPRHRLALEQVLTYHG